MSSLNLVGLGSRRFGLNVGEMGQNRFLRNALDLSVYIIFRDLYDLSAVVTGVLLAFVCPVTIPYWTIILGDFFAIVLVKMLFGGLGKNIVNPALAGRAFLFSWPVIMSNWVKVGFDNAAGLLSTADAVTAASPMSAMHQGALPEESILDMFLGNIGGCIGETSALLLL